MDKEDVVYVYTMEYYVTMRKNEILPFATTWMELEGIMVSEISQSERRIIYFQSYMEFEKLNRRPRGREGKIRYRERGKPKRLSNT